MAAPDGFGAAAAAMGVELSARQLVALEKFATELERWNAKFNLLSRRDVGRIWSRHLLDSLSLAALLTEALAGLPQHEGNVRPRVLDVGTGAGLPGLPLALVEPGLDFVLLDRTARKLRFLDLLIAGLELPNVTTVCADVALWKPEQDFEVVVSRAVAQPEQIWRAAGHLLVAEGCMLLMTGAGRAAGDGVRAAGTKLPSVAVRTLAIPGLDQPHEVTIIRGQAAGRMQD